MSGYSTVDDHRSMLFDSVRNAAYEKAIRSVVTADSIVMDLGCGLGIHGLNAASAGARDVILVEPEAIIEVTRQVVAANRLENVRLAESSAENLELQLELDTPVDLIISVFTGNFLLSEDLLPSLFLARDRFLAPGGQLIPDRARMVVAPVSVPGWYDQNVDCWADNSKTGFDYSAVRRFAANTVYHERPENFAAEFLAPPGQLLELDFHTASHTDCDCELSFRADHPGEMHGWLGWCDMRLGTDWYSTSPQAAATHWSPVLLPLEQPLTVASGDAIELHLKRPREGHWNWQTRCGGASYQGSSFFSQPLSVSRLVRQAEDYRPMRNRDGEIASKVLAMLDGEHSSEAIALELQRQWPEQFSDVESARHRVKRLIDQYG